MILLISNRTNCSLLIICSLLAILANLSSCSTLVKEEKKASIFDKLFKGVRAKAKEPEQATGKERQKLEERSIKEGEKQKALEEKRRQQEEKLERRKIEENCLVTVTE